MGVWQDIEMDYRRYRKRKGNVFTYVLNFVLVVGFRATVLYRFGYWCRSHRLAFVAAILERVMHVTCACDISTMAKIGGGLRITHGFGLVIGSGTEIGRNCDVRQNITFGGNYNKEVDGRKHPVLGDGVSVGAGAAVIGPVKVGNNAVIGANAVVTRDVPENAIVGGVPAKVIKYRWDESTGRKL